MSDSRTAVLTGTYAGLASAVTVRPEHVPTVEESYSETVRDWVTLLRVTETQAMAGLDLFVTLATRAFASPTGVTTVTADEMRSPGYQWMDRALPHGQDDPPDGTTHAAAVLGAWVTTCHSDPERFCQLMARVRTTRRLS